ncbi:OmpA family protein [Massilia soli]|uniref:OmpA family protein n=1 Tax=Massilia soli TaxID=2792854 RepID=A0ABS7SL75_9BURK|nr:OmpA family protein [Massilia soli]MBZ2206566.1 OmpA family protein [Massilia soli]
MRSTKSLAIGLILLPVALAAHAQSNEYAGIPVSTTVYVPFANGSARFTPNIEGIALLASAPTAALVTIRGRTSTAKPTTKDEALALARAISARAYLIERGVSPLKITLNYVSAADFVADNSTVAGRELNQRVEIDIIHLGNEEEY